MSVSSAGNSSSGFPAAEGRPGLICKKVELVVFDLDGTLVDAFEDIAKAANYIRALNGLPVLSVEDVKEHVGYGARQLVERILNSTEPVVVDENHKKLIEFYSNHPGTSTRLYDGAVNVLVELQKRGMQTAIASNKPHPVTQQVVELMGLGPHINFAAGEMQGVPRKPAAEMLLKIMSDAACDPSAVVMVGDTEVDILFARNAGVKAVSVTYGQRSREYLEQLGSDAVIDSLPELLEILPG